MRTMPLAAVAAAVALAAPASASAQDAFLGLRVGYALPFGDVARDLSIRDIAKSHVPLQIDAGFKLGRQWMVGAYTSYSWAQIADRTERACGTADCSANVIRVGLQGALHSEVRPEREAWAGILLGWERLDLNAPGALDQTAGGWELGIQGGFDFATPSTGFGPYTSLTFGRFTSVSVAGDEVDVPAATHLTLQLGIRGYFKL